MMSNLEDYIDGLLDSGAETFPRQVLERIKALARPEPMQLTYSPDFYTLKPPYKITCEGPINIGGATTVVDHRGPVTSGTVTIKGEGFWKNCVPTNSVCGSCGQTDVGQTGEYPCSTCGLPLTWDSRVDVNS